MKKTSIVGAVLSLSLCMALPNLTWASTTRLLSLGLDNWQLADEVNFWSNPARLRAAPNVGIFEMGTQGNSASGLNAGSQWGGFHKSIGSSVLALYVRRPYGTNDFTVNAGPITTPYPGGFLSKFGVIGNPNLSAAADSAAQFGASGGPFGSAGGSVQGLTGAPGAGSSLYNKTLPIPENYLDAIYAWSWGRMDWGVHVNYARNTGGEVMNASYVSAANAAAPGTINLHRISEETNVRAGWLWNGFENSWLQMTTDFTIPHYVMDYFEENMQSGAFTHSRIDANSQINGGASLQFSRKLENDTTYSITARAGLLDATGTAYREDGPTFGSPPLTVRRAAYFANWRKYAGMDFTWGHAFAANKSLLIASMGFLRTNTKQSYTFNDNFAPANSLLQSVVVDQYIVPARVAIEATPWNLLALRGGLQKDFFSWSTSRVQSGQQATQTDTAVTDPTGTANGVGLSFGVGIQLIEGLMWDNVVRQTILFHGPNFIGGAPANGVTGGLFAQSTLVYKWGGGGESAYSSNLRPLIPMKRLISRLISKDPS